MNKYTTLSIAVAMSGLAVPATADCIENGLTLTCAGLTEPVVDNRDGLIIELDEPVEITTSGPVGLSLTGDGVEFPSFRSDGTGLFDGRQTVRSEAGNGVELGDDADVKSPRFTIEAAGVGFSAGDNLFSSGSFNITAGDDALQVGVNASLSTSLTLESTGGDALQMGPNSFLESFDSRIVSTAEDGAGIRLLGDGQSFNTNVFVLQDGVVGNTAILSGDGPGTDVGNKNLFIFGATLVGTGGTAVDLADGDDSFEIVFDTGIIGGASITGDVLLGSGDDQLRVFSETDDFPTLADFSFVDTTFDGGLGTDSLVLSDFFDLTTAMCSTCLMRMGFLPRSRISKRSSSLM